MPQNVYRKVAAGIDKILRTVNCVQGRGYAGQNSIDKEVRSAIRLLGKTPSIAIDVGGNIGNYTACLKKYGCREIHIFEPAKVNVAYLSTRFSGNPKIKINENALSSRDELLNFYADAPGSTLGSLTKRDLSHRQIKFDHNDQVKAIRFDGYWKTKMAKCAIDLVKLDVEGHELDVLHGFGDALHYCKVVQFEFGGSNIDTRTYFRDFWRFFFANGFLLYRITPIGIVLIDKYREADEQFVATNFLAAKPH